MSTDLVVREKPPIPVRRVGRPTLYTPAVAQAICDHIERGLTKRSACAMCDVNETTFELWTQREDFMGMVARAEAKAEVVFTEAMRRGAEGDPEYKGDWKAGESWLKRRRRADYGDTLDIRKVDDETLLRLLHASADIQPAVTEDGLPARIAGDDAL